MVPLCSAISLPKSMKGLLLGLASGANCLATCAPMLFSLLAADAGTSRNRFSLLGFFLLGRAVAYSTLGALAWRFGVAIQQWPAWNSLILGLGLMTCAVLLLWYGFGPGPAEQKREGRLPPNACQAKPFVGWSSLPAGVPERFSQGSSVSPFALRRKSGVTPGSRPQSLAPVGLRKTKISESILQWAGRFF
jgi:hypothetical protein